jgi:hypothetical protein
VSESFGCDVTLCSYESGRLSITFGPLEPGDIKDLLDYLGKSENAADMILDRFAALMTQHAMRDLGEEP